MTELGDELRQRRKELGLELEDAQAATKIRLRYLQALEDGQYEVIPGEVFVKGFLRCYADYLGLDGFSYVERYKESKGSSNSSAGGGPSQSATAASGMAKEPVAVGDNAETPNLSVQLREAKPRGGIFKTKPRRGGVGALGRLALFIGLGLIVYAVAFGSGGFFNGIEVGSPRGEGVGKETPKENGNIEDGKSKEDGSTVKKTSNETAEAAPDNEAAKETVTVTRVIYRNDVTYNVMSESLTVDATTFGDCWVRVVADGKQVFEGQMAAGDKQVWQAINEIFIRAGRPTSIRLTVNGRPLDPLSLGNAANIYFKRGN